MTVPMGNGWSVRRSYTIPINVPSVNIRFSIHMMSPVIRCMCRFSYTCVHYRFPRGKHRILRDNRCVYTSLRATVDFLGEFNRANSPPVTYVACADTCGVTRWTMRATTNRRHGVCVGHKDVLRCCRHPVRTNPRYANPDTNDTTRTT
jgi:hypothetical protein